MGALVVSVIQKRAADSILSTQGRKCCSYNIIWGKGGMFFLILLTLILKAIATAISLSAAVGITCNVLSDGTQIWWKSRVNFLSAVISEVLDFRNGYTVPSVIVPQSS